MFRVTTTFFLAAMDRAMERLGVFYARFMEEWAFLPPSRWKLLKAICLVNQDLARKVAASGRTFIGRIRREKHALKGKGA